MKHYPLPNFKSLQPNYLVTAVREIYKSKLLEEKDDGNISEDRYKIALEKFIKREQLKKRDYIILLYFIDDLIKLGYFAVFFNQFIKEVENYKITASFCYPLLAYIYNFFDKPDKEILIIYKQLQQILKANQHKRRLKEIFNLTISNDNFSDYLKRINEKYRAVTNIDDFKILNRQYYIKNTDKFYFKCIGDFIIINHQRNELWDFLSKTVKSMDLKNKKMILEKIMLYYEHAYDEKDFHNEWFALIKQELRDPYETGNSRWEGISEKAQDIYRRWNVLKSIHKFFMEISGGDERRLNYWKGHVNNITRIEYFQELNKALVMEFPNHIIIEFAEKNNACYIYPKGIINISELYKINQSYISRQQKIKYLKNDNCLKKLFHYDKWEEKFDQALRQQFNYKKR